MRSLRKYQRLLRKVTIHLEMILEFLTYMFVGKFSARFKKGILPVCLFVLRFNILVDKISVMVGLGYHFLGIILLVKV